MSPEAQEQKVVLTDLAPQVITPVNHPPLTPEEAAVGHRTVTMVFEHEVLFTIAHGRKVRYPKGVHEVPEPWSNHWFLINSGVRPYNRPIAPGAPQNLIVPATSIPASAKVPRKSKR